MNIKTTSLKQKNSIQKKMVITQRKYNKNRITKRKRYGKRHEIRIKNKTQFLKKAKLFNQMFAWFNPWNEYEYPVILKHSLKKKYRIVKNLKKKLFNRVLHTRKENFAIAKFKQNKKLITSAVQKASYKLATTVNTERKQFFWLTKQLATYQKTVRIKIRKDFFQTNIGLILATAHRYSYNRPVIWRNLPQMYSVNWNIQNKEGILPIWRIHRIVEERSKLGLLYNSVHSLKKKNRTTKNEPIFIL